MIGRLKGTVDGIGEDHVILDVHGVGYLVHCSARTLQRLPKEGEAARLSIETVVREDMIRLYGFRTDAEREWFRAMQLVQGVGARVALGILSVLDPDDLARAVSAGDKAALARAPGVGPKLAQRIVSEMKDKAPGFGTGDSSLAALSGGAEAGPSAAASDAISALVNLGYAQVQATNAIARAVEQAGADAQTPTLIRLGLKELAR
ncbi:Holliday junction branch migration protein RuvA [Salinarimonas sp.]|uniref:Holliday junction branch migration protein RuvA n=1 Tax=Salinarimonas sp. TaxID=2766526 RepID=UPI00391D6BB8